MSRSLCYFAFGILLRICMCRSEIFTSSAHLEFLTTAGQSAVRNIDAYIGMEKERLAHLRIMAKSLSTGTYRKQFDESPPINALLSRKLRTFQRFKAVADVRLAAEDLATSKLSENEYLGNISGFPSDQDLTGASSALFRLQDVYKLSASDMANGKIQGAAALSEIMSAHDCYELGRQAYKAFDYYHCIIWMQEAIRRLKLEKVEPTVEMTEIMDHLSYALFEQGNLQRALSMTKTLAQMKPRDPRPRKNMEYYDYMMKKKGIKIAKRPPPIINQRPNATNGQERRVFESLCQDSLAQTDDTGNTGLSCYYKTNPPYLTLARLKVEILNLVPMVVIFRDVLSDYEASVIKQLAIPQLKRAAVFNRKTGKQERTDFRITKSAWLESTEHPVIRRLDHRLEAMTDLDQSGAEDLQVANYGLGGHYSPHFDHTAKGETNPFDAHQGNRIATVLFYLNTPTAGGATVFLSLKKAVSPRAGDALFWYNLRQSGEPDNRTKHAACPVLVGHKWVSNKWIGERKQELRRPCGVKFDSEQERIG